LVSECSTANGIRFGPINPPFGWHDGAEANPPKGKRNPTVSLSILRHPSLQKDEDDRNEDTNPVDKDEEFDLDGDIDLESPLLDGMLCDRRLPQSRTRR
jgi:hypothetical protein